MTSAPAPHMGRLDELLADRAVQALTESEALELDRLLASAPHVDADSFDRAAAAATLAMAAPAGAAAIAVEPLPAALRRRIQADAEARLGGGAGIPGRRAGLDLAPPAPVLPRRDDSRSAPRSSTGRLVPAWAAYSGWALAAVLALAAGIAWLPGLRPASPTLPAEPVALSPEQRRDQLLAQSGVAVIQAAWVNPADESPQPGDVVWDNQRQEGYMRLASLPPNNPSVEQYQLWILVPDQEHPIDGGVFDISRKGEVVIPIDAKLRVSSPVAFAVTVEKPGGVVVSDRQRLPLLAMVNR